MANGGGMLGYVLGMPEHHRERKEELADEDRKLRVADLYGKANALSKVIPALSGEHRDRAMKALTDIEQNLTSIYHPDKNPGALQKDWNWLQHYISGKKPQADAITNLNPDATVTPDLNLTPDAQPKSVGELRAAIANMPGAPSTTIPGSSVDVRPAPELLTKQQRKQQQQRDDARQRAAQDVEAASGLTPEEEAQQKQKLDEEHLQWQLDWAKRHNVGDEAIKELTEHLAGVPTPKARLKPMGKPYQDSEDKLWKQPMYDAETGKVEDVPMGANYTPPPEHQSMYQQQRNTFAASLGKTPAQLTWQDERSFLTQRYGAQQPLAQKRLDLAEERLAISQADLTLRRSENNMKDYLSITKELSPLGKIQTTADRADEFVETPSGPGDVSLVFAFIDATKPGSGFRFTNTEQAWITSGSRGVIDGALTRINQGFTGETLSPDQRAQMSGIIKNAATQASEQRDRIVSATEQINPTAAGVAAAATPPDAGDKKGKTGKTDTGGGGAQKSKSLAAAMKLPGWTEAQVIQDLSKHGYGYVRP